MSKPRKLDARVQAKPATNLRQPVQHKPPKKCEICGADVAPISDGSLCWVCRRLKVSAWNEGVDSQMFAAE